MEEEKEADALWMVHLWCNDVACEDCFRPGGEVYLFVDEEEARRQFNSIFESGTWDGTLKKKVDGEWVPVSPPEEG